MRSLLLLACLSVSACALVAGRANPTVSVSVGDNQEQPEDSNDHQQDSLPPDTFRKLAQALYQRGEQADSRAMERKYLYDRNATCNDGSTAGYYIRRNYQSKRWIVFLEGEEEALIPTSYEGSMCYTYIITVLGGWICHDEHSCAERAAREPHRMSSDRWPSVKTVGGILSADPLENPHFADANHVFVPYCSSDSW